jgi:hypothetical protein
MSLDNKEGQDYYLKMHNPLLLHIAQEVANSMDTRNEHTLTVKELTRILLLHSNTSQDLFISNLLRQAQLPSDGDIWTMGMIYRSILENEVKRLVATKDLTYSWMYFDPDMRIGSEYMWWVIKFAWYDQSLLEALDAK